MMIDEPAPPEVPLERQSSAPAESSPAESSPPHAVPTTFYRTAHEALMNQPATLHSNCNSLLMWLRARPINARTFVVEGGTIYVLNLASTAFASQRNAEGGALLNVAREVLAVPAVFSLIEPDLPFFRLGQFINAEPAAVLARKILQDVVRGLTAVPNIEFMPLMKKCANSCDEFDGLRAGNAVRILCTALGKRTCAKVFVEQKFFFDDVALGVITQSKKNVELAGGLEIIKRAHRFDLIRANEKLKSALASIVEPDEPIQTLLREATELVFPSRPAVVLGEKRTLGKKAIIDQTKNKRFVFQPINPKQPKTKSHQLYEQYKSATNLDEFLDSGGRYADIPWDSFHGYLKVF
jgi:hypothetical protein